MTTHYPYDKAAACAAYIAELLRPHCTRLHIAGSIRRMRLEVKDIEIVCEPKKEFIQTGLFKEEGEWHVIKDFSESLAIITDFIFLGKVEGRYMRIKTNSKKCPGIWLDLFMPQPHDYYRQYAIRTGSADYAHNVIAGAWRRKGWTGIKDIGLRLIKECNSHKDNNNKTIYTLKELAAFTLPPVWQSEGEFFTWLNIPYIDPENREYHKPVNQAQ